MSTSHQLRHIVAISLSLFLLVPGFSQIKYGAKNNINLTVAGTSTMHDWTMKSASGDCAVLKDAVLSTKDNKTYSLKGSMKLTIAGKTLDTDLQATLTRKPDHSIQVKGDKKISMKEYGMEPPSFMMGTIKTGNDITLSFDLNLNK
ncbi:MAG: YceI family protein [Saprospiraceae bacterium]|nr:YceI family protein [Saprospiraceae bacterium]